MFRNLIGSGSSMAPQRCLACLSARSPRKEEKNHWIPSPQLPSIICMQWPSNPPALFPSDPPFHFHLSYFHIDIYALPQKTSLVFCPGHCNFFKQKDSIQVFSTSTPTSQDPVSLHLLLKTLQQKNKEKWCVASSAATLNQHSYFEFSGKICPWQ